MQKSYTEGDLYFAISDITLKRVKSISCAIAIYKIPRIIVRNWRARIRLRSNYELNSKRLINLEEEVIKQYILNASLRGVPPIKPLV
jgi:hypothetical protein